MGSRQRSSVQPLTGYSIEMVSQQTGVSRQRIRVYQRRGLIRPSSTTSGAMVFDAEQIDSIQRIERLINDLELNLAGVEVVFHMREQILVLQREIDRLNRLLDS